MKTLCTVSIFALLLSSIRAHSHTGSQIPTTREPTVATEKDVADVSLSARIDRISYALGEEIHLDVLIRNNGPGAVRPSGEFPNFVSVRDVQLWSEDGCLLAPSESGSKLRLRELMVRRGARMLERGGIVRQHFRVDKLFDLKSPGPYKIVIRTRLTGVRRKHRVVIESDPVMLYVAGEK